MEENNKKIEERKENKEMKKQIKPLRRKIFTIYDYFSDYSKEEINTVLIEELTISDRYLLEISYGKDLENPVRSDEWNADYSHQFYGSLIPKIRVRLQHRYGKRGKELLKAQEKKAEKEIKAVVRRKKKIEEQDMSKISNASKPSIEKEDYIKILELLKNASFGEMLKVLSPKEAVIICLTMGYIDGKYFSTSSIANFLSITEEEVRETTKKILLVYKENINQFIEEAIKMTTDDTLLRERTQNYLQE